MLLLISFHVSTRALNIYLTWPYSWSLVGRWPQHSQGTYPAPIFERLHDKSLYVSRLHVADHTSVQFATMTLLTLHIIANWHDSARLFCLSPSRSVLLSIWPTSSPQVVQQPAGQLSEAGVLHLRGDDYHARHSQRWRFGGQVLLQRGRSSKPQPVPAASETELPRQRVVNISGRNSRVLRCRT